MYYLVRHTRCRSSFDTVFSNSCSQLLDDTLPIHILYAGPATCVYLRADGEPAKKMNLLQELTGPLKKFLKMKEKPM